MRRRQALTNTSNNNSLLKAKYSKLFIQNLFSRNMFMCFVESFLWWIYFTKCRLIHVKTNHFFVKIVYVKICIYTYYIYADYHLDNLKDIGHYIDILVNVPTPGDIEIHLFEQTKYSSTKNLKYYYRYSIFSSTWACFIYPFFLNISYCIQ